MTLRSADFESAASASSAIPALHCNFRKLRSLRSFDRTAEVGSIAPVEAAL